jgi:uncharacterized protein (DUF1330 family)
MPAYLIADETIEDPETFEHYKRAVLPLITRFGGSFLSRGGQLEVLESGRDWSPDRMVIIQFPSMSALKDWYIQARNSDTSAQLTLATARFPRPQLSSPGL